MNSETGKWIIMIGLSLLIIGTIIYFFHDKLHWIGRLPGDIRIDRPQFRFYLPLTTMLLLSVLITIVINLIKKIF